MRIAVTGGTGFIGRYLARRLILEGHEVVLLARRKNAGSEWFHYMLARFWELTMKVPLVARAQVRILSEGVLESALPCDPLPNDLVPTRQFTDDQISNGLPAPGSFTFRDLRFCA